MSPTVVMASTTNPPQSLTQRTSESRSPGSSVVGILFGRDDGTEDNGRTPVYSNVARRSASADLSSNVVR
ncbi:MAG: hypothetical protein KDA72_22570, partial [Planctomycetales bacterium]|nr:hypothetical protein [Planctomycetales bacterium]